MMGRTFGKRSAIRAATAAIFIWRTLPAPRRWARRIWAQLTRHQKRSELMSVAPYHKLILSYPDFSLATRALQWLTSKLCFTVLPYRSSKQMAINVLSVVFRKFSGLYASLTVYELQTPDSELSYVLNDCGLRLQRSQPFSRSCSAFWERRVVSWT